MRIITTLYVIFILLMVCCLNATLPSHAENENGQQDTTGPFILSLTYSPEQPCPNEDILITAKLIDESEISSVILQVKLSGETDWTNYSMNEISHEGNNSTYSYTIVISQDLAVVDFQIYAYDEYNNYNTDGIRTFQVRSDHPGCSSQTENGSSSIPGFSPDIVFFSILLVLLVNHKRKDGR